MSKDQSETITLPKQAKILVVKLAGIGDLLLATPALQSLRETYPDAEIDLLVTPAAAGLLKQDNIINHIIVLDKYLFDSPKDFLLHLSWFLKLLKFGLGLRSRKYDAVLLMHHLTLPFGRLKYRFLLAAVHAKKSIGLDNSHGSFLDIKVKDEGFGVFHEAQYGLHLASALGAPAADRPLYIPISQDEKDKALRLVQTTLDLRDVPDQQGRLNAIAMHPGSGTYSTARRWPAERFTKVAEYVYNEYKLPTLLLGGAEEADVHQQIVESTSTPVYSLAGKTTLQESAAILELCQLFVGNDSSLMHMATAVQTPVIAIFSLTNHLAWGPYSGGTKPENYKVVRLDLPCSPCFYRGHSLGTPQGCATRECIYNLSAEMVITEVKKMLEQVKVNE